MVTYNESFRSSGARVINISGAVPIAPAGTQPGADAVAVNGMALPTLSSNSDQAVIPLGAAPGGMASVPTTHRIVGTACSRDAGTAVEPPAALRAATQAVPPSADAAPDVTAITFTQTHQENMLE